MTVLRFPIQNDPNRNDPNRNDPNRNDPNRNDPAPRTANGEPTGPLPEAGPAGRAHRSVHGRRHTGGTRLSPVSANHPSFGSLGQVWAEEPGSTRGKASLVISCSTCCMADTDACSDCVVSLLAHGPSQRRSVELDADEATTIDLFRRAGLVPHVRHAVGDPLGVVNW